MPAFVASRTCTGIATRLVGGASRSPVDLELGDFTTPWPNLTLNLPIDTTSRTTLQIAFPPATNKEKKGRERKREKGGKKQEEEKKKKTKQITRVVLFRRCCRGFAYKHGRRRETKVRGAIPGTAHRIEAIRGRLGTEEWREETAKRSDQGKSHHR